MVVGLFDLEAPPPPSAPTLHSSRFAEKRRVVNFFLDLMLPRLIEWFHGTVSWNGFIESFHLMVSYLAATPPLGGQLRISSGGWASCILPYEVSREGGGAIESVQQLREGFVYVRQRGGRGIWGEDALPR